MGLDVVGAFVPTTAGIAGFSLLFSKGDCHLEEIVGLSLEGYK
jgi:hypothetical protein